MPAAAVNGPVNLGTPNDRNPAQQGYGNIQSQFYQNYPIGQQAQTQAGISQLYQQLPQIQGYTQLQTQQAQQEAGFQQQQLGLQGQQYGIQAGALQRQFGLVPEQYGLAQAGLNVQQGALQRQQALDPKLQALTEQQYGQQHTDIQAAFGQQTRALESQGVAGGGLFSHGQASAGGYLQEQHKSALGGLATSKKSEELGYREQLKSLQDQFKQLGIQRLGSTLSFHEQMASLQDQKANLDILQKQLGISSQEITTRTNNAIAQLQLQGVMDAQQAQAGVAQFLQGEAQSGPLANAYAALATAIKTGSAKAIG
jgi:hypothetical protein